MSTTATPALMPKFKQPAVQTTDTEPVERIVAEFVPQAGARVRPGFKVQIVEVPHTGEIKAKELVRMEPGTQVRAFLHGEPRGGVRTVAEAVPNEDGSVVTVTFSSAHPVTEYKAAYRFHVEALVGTPVQIRRQVPALVDYEEV